MAGPLDGIKVIDISAVISGPMACQVLADQGAEVVKVEPLQIGDLTRIGGFRVGDISAMYASANRGKASVALDLGQEPGVEAFKKLCADADVLVQNFRPGAVDRMGIGPAVMHEINPDLIYVSISGFGPSGPYKDGRVYDPIIQSVSGVVSVQQSPEIPIPDLVRTLICDKSTALTVAGAISSALYARAIGRCRGQHIEVPMLDTALYWLWPDVYMGHTLMGDDVVPGALLYQIYRLQQVADGHLVYFAATDKEMMGLFQALGHPEWMDDDRFDTPQKRQNLENFQALGALLHAAFLEMTVDEAMDALNRFEVPAARVNTLEQVFEDPQVVHSDIIRSWDDPQVGPVRMAKPPVRWGETQPEIRWTFDALGQSTEAVLRAHGYGDDDLAALRESGVIPA